jgi:predicted nucleic acid-binding protein
MNPVFIDTNIPMYAGGTDHPLREPSQQVIKAIVSGQLDALTDAEVLQEILYRYLHIQERQKGFRIFDLFRRIMLGRILPIDDADVQQAREFAEVYPALSPRDLIHLSILTRHNLKVIVTADLGFDLVKEITRIDPQDIAGLLKNR